MSTYRMKLTIAKSLKDILSKDVMLFVIKIALGSIVLSGAIMYMLWTPLTGLISSYLSWIPWEWVQNTGAGIVNILLIYIMFTIIVSLLSSLFSEKLLIKIAKKHYPNSSIVGSPNIATSTILTLKATALFLVLFIVAIPFLFIPILGQIVMLYLWSILIKKPTIYDVSSLFIFDKQHYKKKSKKATSIAMIASLFNYVPLLNIFAPVYAQILFLHHIFNDAPPATNH